MEVTVKIYENKMVLTANGNTINVEPTKPFTTTRLLVGTFTPAVECLKEGLLKVGATGFLKGKPKLLILPQSMTEGGLSEIEERCLLEVGLSAGAGKAEIRTS
jgi:rod shape-determining protein MreB